jgi:hypothetical protein
VSFFNFFGRATLSNDEPTVLGITISVELNPTTCKTGGDGILQLAVIGMGGAVLRHVHQLGYNVSCDKSYIAKTRVIHLASRMHAPSYLIKFQSGHSCVIHAK